MLSTGLHLQFSPSAEAFLDDPVIFYICMITDIVIFRQGTDHKSQLCGFHTFSLHLGLGVQTKALVHALGSHLSCCHTLRPPNITPCLIIDRMTFQSLLPCFLALYAIATGHSGVEKYPLAKVLKKTQTTIKSPACPPHSDIL